MRWRRRSGHRGWPLATDWLRLIIGTLPLTGGNSSNEDQRAREERRKDCGVAEGPEDARMSNLRYGWYWGKQAFREKLEAMTDDILKVRPNRNYAGASKQQRHDEKEAERIVSEGLARFELANQELKD